MAAACCLYGAFIMSMFLQRYGRFTSSMSPANKSPYFIDPEDEPEISEDTIGRSDRIVHYSIHGMTCSNCAADITSELSSELGVKRVNISLLLERADILYDRLLIHPNSIRLAVERAGYTATAENTASHYQSHLDEFDWWANFLWSLLFTGPILLMQQLPSKILPPRIGEVSTLILATFVQFGFGAPFYSKSWKTFRSRRGLNMDFLVAWSTSIAHLVSILSFAFHWQESFVLTTSSLISTISFGRYIESRSRRRVTSLFRAFSSTVPTNATLLGATEDIPTKMLRSGDLVVVQPKEMIPCDGRLSTNFEEKWPKTVEINESFHTGESLPVLKQCGDLCLAGTSNGSCNAILIEVSEDGKSRLHKILDAVMEAQLYKSETELTVDYVAARFVPATFLLSLFTFFYWYGEGPFKAVRFMTSVLVVACPCALGLSTPTAVMVGTARAAEQGIIFKSGAQAFEMASKINRIILDKTGTVTTGHLELSRYQISGDWDSKVWWRLICGAEIQSEHWAAETILNYGSKTLPQESFATAEVQEYKYIPGRGVHCFVDGTAVLLGNLKHLQDRQIQGISQAKIQTKDLTADETVIFVALDGNYSGYLVMKDNIQAGAVESIRKLKEMGVKIEMMTGDRLPVARKVALALGITQVSAEVTPHEKLARVIQMQQEGDVVAMVGDGINDTTALASADVGIAMKRGPRLAIEAADIVLLHSNITDVVQTLKLARATFFTIRTNLLWAVIYNLVCLPIAAGFCSKWGYYIHPNICGPLMIGSSLVVAYNSMRLQRMKL